MLSRSSSLLHMGVRDIMVLNFKVSVLVHNTPWSTWFAEPSGFVWFRGYAYSSWILLTKKVVPMYIRSEQVHF